MMTDTTDGAGGAKACLGVRAGIVRPDNAHSAEGKRE